MKLANCGKILIALLPILVNAQGVDDLISTHATILTDGLVFYAKLDGDGADFSGQTNTVSLIGSPAWTGNVPVVTFAKSAALTLNGASQYGNSAHSLASITGAMARTFSAWCRTTNIVMTDQVMLQTGGSATLTDFELDLNPSFGGSATQCVYVGLGGANRGWKFTYADGAWHNFVLIYPGGDISNSTCFADGLALTSVVSTAHNTPATTIGPIYIGSSSNTPYFQGSLAEARIYDLAISTNEARWLGKGTK